MSTSRFQLCPGHALASRVREALSRLQAIHNVLARADVLQMDHLRSNQHKMTNTKSNNNKRFDILINEIYDTSMCQNHGKQASSQQTKFSELIISFVYFCMFHLFRLLRIVVRPHRPNYVGSCISLSESVIRTLWRQPFDRGVEGAAAVQQGCWVGRCIVET